VRKRGGEQVTLSLDALRADISRANDEPLAARKETGQY
jgi:hypothetical protein